MFSTYLRGLILSASLAIFVYAAPVPPRQPHTLNAFGILADSTYLDLTYDKVSACYNSIPFNREAAATTLESVYSLFDNFIPSAILLWRPPLDPPSQEIRVFKDDGHRGCEDCIVQTIDGQDALTYLKAWADKYVYYSKDPDVRLNQALATQAYDSETGTFEMEAGEFSLRRRVPENAYIDYGLQCNGSASTIQVRDNWDTFPVYKREFHDAASFVENACLSPTPESAAVSSSSTKRLIGMYHPEVPRKVRKAMPVVEDERLAAAAAPKIVPKPILRTATRIGGNETVVYQLQDHPHVGVVVVPTHSIDSGESTELDSLYESLVKLHNNGVTNLIIDMQNNGGGYVSFASELVQMFFPNKDILDSALPSNLRVPKPIEEVARLGFNQSWSDLYISVWFYDYTAKDSYTNDDLFTKPIASTRYGCTANYSETISLNPFILTNSVELMNFTSTNNPSQIRLLTDGRCGSSCSMSEFFFTRYNNVIAYAIGGFPNIPLSKSLFPGGVVGEQQ
ncbi:hypothetical protein BGX29_010916 [Mortierella sp. GBA35]|nr:hypothetical protein BGX29_010916 [Mortierella sp. GBA35]